jgi:hypothetical protein
MCQKDLASYRLRLLLSRSNADEIVNNLKLAFTGQLYHGYETPKQALYTDSAASCGVLYPPLCGIVQLTNSAALRFRNWSFTNKKIQLKNHLLFNITGNTFKPVSFFINLSSLEIC